MVMVVKDCQFFFVEKDDRNEKVRINVLILKCSNVNSEVK